MAFFGILLRSSAHKGPFAIKYSMHCNKPKDRIVYRQTRAVKGRGQELVSCNNVAIGSSSRREFLLCLSSMVLSTGLAAFRLQSEMYWFFGRIPSCVCWTWKGLCRLILSRSTFRSALLLDTIVSMQSSIHRGPADLSTRFLVLCPLASPSWLMMQTAELYLLPRILRSSMLPTVLESFIEASIYAPFSIVIALHEAMRIWTQQDDEPQELDI